MLEKLIDKMIKLAEEAAPLANSVTSYSPSAKALDTLLETMEEVALTLEENFDKDIAHSTASGILAQDANEVDNEDMGA